MTILAGMVLAAAPWIGWADEWPEPKTGRLEPEYEDFQPSPIPLGGRVALLISPAQWAIATIVQEALGEPYEGKVAVGEVIRARMKRRYSSDGTVAGTVLRPYQFSGWRNTDPALQLSGMADDEHPKVAECIRAWHESRVTNLTEGAVLYHADYVAPGWSERATFIKKIGRHLFYGD